MNIILIFIILLSSDKVSKLGLGKVRDDSLIYNII